MIGFLRTFQVRAMIENKPFLDYTEDLRLGAVWAIATDYNLNRTWLMASFKDVNPKMYINKLGVWSIPSIQWYQVENRYYDYKETNQN